MPNLKLFLQDLGASRVRSIYLNKDIAVLELMSRERSISTQIQINMNVEVAARPYMAGELEKEPFLRKAFYLGKMFGLDHTFDLTDENILTISSKNQLGHAFTLELLNKNELGQTSWWITQGEFSKDRDVFFKCDHQGNITTPQEILPESLWFFEKFAREENDNDSKSVQELKGKRLQAIHFGYPMRLFFSDANNPDEDNLDIWLDNGSSFSGQMALKPDVLKDQYHDCETGIEYCCYAQFITEIVENVTLDASGNLILDFENKTTLSITGNPPSDEYSDTLWVLSASRNRHTLYEQEAIYKPFESIPVKETRFNQRDLLKHIDAYMKLQLAILNLFAEEYPYARRYETFNQCPKKGSIYLDGSEWSFWKHGQGFTFTQEGTGLELNIHDHFYDPNRLDEWRIFCYLNSLFPDDQLKSSTIKFAMEELADKGGNALHKRGTKYTWDVEKTKNIFPSFFNFLRSKK